MRKIFTVFLFILLFSTNSFAIKIGDIAPDFTLKNLKGENISLSNYKNKIVILHFWATWCPYCKDEFPSLEKFYKDMNTDKIVVLTIKTKDKIFGKKFITEKDINLPILLDNDNKVAKLYQISGLPETYVIDKNNTIIEHIIGSINWTDKKVIDYFKGLLRP